MRIVRALLAGATLSLLFGACSDDERGGGSFVKGEDLVIDVAPNPVTFGTVLVDSHAERIVTIRHAGTDGVLQLRRVTLETESAELTISQPLVTELGVGESTTMAVLYDPVDTQQDRGTVFIHTNIASAGGSLVVEVPIETLTQVATLRVIPDPVDFGEVESNTLDTKVVSFINEGADNIEVTNVAVSGGVDGDFSLVLGPANRTYAPKDQFSVEVGYAPTNGGSDTGTLAVEYVADGETHTVETLLLGAEVGPKLVAFPNPVDFAWQTIDETVTRPLTVSNQGRRDLVITDVRLGEGSSDTVVVTGFPAGGVTVTPSSSGNSDVLALTVGFTPTSQMPQTTGPIAEIVIESNDSANGGEFLINVFGRAEAPLLQVNPPEFVDFGYVAQNLTTQRKISLYNAGSAPLTVDAITLVDNTTSEFELVTDSSWAPLSASPGQGVLDAGEYREVKVTFTNSGADTGTEWAKLRIQSNDGQQPDWQVDLKAQRAGSPTCEVRFVPEQLDFGTVPRGFKKSMVVNMEVVGSGECSFHSALINDCASFFGFFGGTCDDPSTTIQQSGSSEFYEVTMGPPAIQGGLKPGNVYPIEVTFTPPDSAPIFGDDLVDYAGLLAVRTIDPYSGSSDPVLYPEAVGGGLSPYPPNLHAKSGVPNLAVLPQEVDFGLTTIGCHSQTVTVTAYNIGTAPLDLTNVELQGCSVEFKIKSAPGLPTPLDPDASVEFDVVYIPQDLGDDACSLAFYTDTDTPMVVVPLAGGGTYETEHTDEFVQTNGTEVDVLFVVDNSGSMGDEQNNLASNFSNFITAAAGWSADYHIGVTSTDMDADSGRLIGTPRFVTNADWQAFENNVRLGDSGSATEQGLAASQAALSLPRTADSDVACSDDAGCPEPERCYDGFCGGSNRGFLRSDAALEVVYVSDEEDSSPADLNFYINFLKSIKGFYNENMFHAHAIVGPAGGCSTSSGNGGAAAGLRYIDVANATGGNVGSVCSPSFASHLTSIGDIAFGLRTQFFLSRVADPGTIEVTVAGAGCTDGGGSNWVYDAASNSVIFVETGGCMPQVDETIEIHYETLCLLE